MAHCLFYLEIQTTLQQRKVSILPCAVNYPAHWQTGVSVSLNSSRPGDLTVTLCVGSAMLSLFLACLNTASECALMGKGYIQLLSISLTSARIALLPVSTILPTCQQFQCHFRVNYSLNQILFKAIPTLVSVCVSLLMDYHMCCITISPLNTICRSCGQSLNHHIDFHQLFGPPMSGAELRCCYFYVEIDGLSSYTSFYLFCYSNLSIWPHADTVLTTEYGMGCVFYFYFFPCIPFSAPPHYRSTHMCQDWHEL